MIKNTICLDENYSTTRLVTQEKPEIINKSEDKFESVLFLPESEGRKGEGGLRTRGYFKSSYKKGIRDKGQGVSGDIEHKIKEADNESWYITDEDNMPIETVTLPPISYPLSHNQLPLISIITVVYNGEKYLEETIQSVINQTYPNIEYIIIDGGSIDGTLDIIRKYEDHIDYWVSENDAGISDAFNKGIIQASGYILMLNAGDVFVDNQILGICYKYLQKDIVVFEVVSNSGRKVGISSFKKDKSLLAKVPHQGTFVHKSVYKKVGGYSLGFKIRMDYEFFSRLVTLYKYEIKFVNIIVVKFDNSGISSSLKHRINFEKEGIIIDYLYFKKSINRICYLPFIKFLGSFIKRSLICNLRFKKFF
jgi:hypothetical protein